MNIFGFKLDINWQSLKGPQMMSVVNFLVSQMSKKELETERAKIKAELQAAQNHVARAELNAQDDILGLALMVEKFTPAAKINK